jgi:Zn-dependent protease with chaperone function
MSEQTVRTSESVQKEIRKLRHKAELPIFVINSILGPVFACILGIALFGEYGIVDLIKEGLANAEITETSPEFSAFLLGFIAVIASIGAIGFVCYLVFLSLFEYYKTYADNMSYGIRVSEENFPEIYAKVKEFSQLLGFKKEPEVYVEQMNGSINAYASWVPGKNYVHLNAEVIELLYLEHKDLDTISFIMGHEFGHIYYKHTVLHYNFFANLVNMIPVFGQKFMGPLLQRAREYSVDRVAQVLTDGKCGSDTMMFLSAGRHVYKYVNVDDYMSFVNKDKNFLEKFARFVTNLVASHPISPFRTKAILDPTQKSGRLL